MYVKLCAEMYLWLTTFGRSNRISSERSLGQQWSRIPRLDMHGSRYARTLRALLARLRLVAYPSNSITAAIKNGGNVGTAIWYVLASILGWRAQPRSVRSPCTTGYLPSLLSNFAGLS